MSKPLNKVVTRGWKFYPMYGQTKATARMSFLCPQRVKSKPASIGRAIPGGKLLLIDKNKDVISEPNVEGELVYYGPNVMMGYAASLEHLADGDVNFGQLHTGDLAYFDTDGDFFIVGRMKRYLKMFGIRMSLDQLESQLEKHGYECICTGVDDNMKVFVFNIADIEDVKSKLIAQYKLNTNFIEVNYLNEIPRTLSGKIDYFTLSKMEFTN